MRQNHPLYTHTHTIHSGLWGWGDLFPDSNRLIWKSSPHEHSKLNGRLRWLPWVFGYEEPKVALQKVLMTPKASQTAKWMLFLLQLWRVQKLAELELMSLKRLHYWETGSHLARLEPLPCWIWDSLDGMMPRIEEVKKQSSKWPLT